LGDWQQGGGNETGNGNGGIPKLRAASQAWMSLREGGRVDMDRVHRSPWLPACSTVDPHV